MSWRSSTKTAVGKSCCPSFSSMAPITSQRRCMDRSSAAPSTSPARRYNSSFGSSIRKVSASRGSSPSLGCAHCWKKKCTPALLTQLPAHFATALHTLWTGPITRKDQRRPVDQMPSDTNLLHVPRGKNSWVRRSLHSCCCLSLLPHAAPHLSVACRPELPFLLWDEYATVLIICFPALLQWPPNAMGDLGQFI